MNCQRGKVFHGILLVMVFTVFSTSASFSADIESRLATLEETLRKQQKQIEEQKKMIDRLKDDLERKECSSGDKVPDSAEANPASRAAVTDGGSPEKREKPPAISGALGDAFKNAKNPYITFVLNSFFYSSSIDERKLKDRGISGFSSVGYDQKKGFNIEEGSISLFAPVDRYFDLFGVASFTESEASLEEAYFYTKSLPAGLRLKGGKFRSSFASFNELHPHDWDFADTALIYRGFMSTQGINEKGAQLMWRPPLPLQPLFGFEVLQGENEVLFNTDSTGGPHAFTGYAKGLYTVSERSKIYFGPYVITGQTRTDSVRQGTFFRGNSSIYGFEVFYRWKPSESRSLTIQGEYMWRKQQGDLEQIATGATGRLVRSQDGMYIQSLYETGKWRIGARYDRLCLLTDMYRYAGIPENFGNPWRLTGALEFNPSDYARFRLQYNYDRSGGKEGYGGGPKTNNEVYLQMIFGIGAHAEPEGQRDLSQSGFEKYIR